jgi:hypothetical protein
MKLYTIPRTKEILQALVFTDYEEAEYHLKILEDTLQELNSYLGKQDNKS